MVRLALLHKEGHLNFALTVTRGLEQQVQAGVIMEVTDQTMRRFIDGYDVTLCIQLLSMDILILCCHYCMYESYLVYNLYGISWFLLKRLLATIF